MKIDFHTHILPKDWPDFKERYGYAGWIKLNHHCQGRAQMLKDDNLFRVIEDNCWSAESRLREMDETGVDVQVLSTVPVMFSYWAKPNDTVEVSEFLNNDLAKFVKAHPTRFVGLGTLPMQAPELAVKELIRCRKELGFPGVQIGSHVNEWNLDAPELRPVFAAAEAHDCTIFVHPWDMELKGRYKKYWLPWLVGMPAETTVAICSIIFGGVLERFPKLKICFAHGGGAFPFTIGRIEHGFNVRPDLCQTESTINPRRYLGQIFTDSLVHDKTSLKLLMDVMGEDQIVLGSDYPFPLGEHHPGSLVESDDSLTDAQKEKILSGNAVKLLGLDPSLYKSSKTSGAAAVASSSNGVKCKKQRTS